MEIGEHLVALRREGERLADAAARTDPAAAVPTTPGWTVRDLVCHLGDVHRWAAAHVAERRTERIGRDELHAMVGPLPPDPDLIAWFRDGHRRLVEVLEGADPDVACWSFLPAPSPLAFWARRQAHETSIHRADAESQGGAITPFGPAFSVDGVDELLFGFFASDADVGGPGHVLHLRATDVDAEWRVGIREAVIASRRGPGPAACTVAAPASDLYLLLWNRLGAAGLDVEGDVDTLDAWRDVSQVTWGGARDG